MRLLISVIIVLLAQASAALAQSTPNFSRGFVPTAAQWNSYFAAKQDVLGYPALNKNGDTMLGRFKIALPSGSFANFNIAQGSAPSGPVAGDVWITDAGMFYRLGGTTIGPLFGATSLSGTSPIIYNSSNGNISLDTGTSGHKIGFLDGTNTHSGVNAFSDSVLFSGPHPFVDVSAYGASTSASAAANKQAIQAAIDATPVGGIALLIGATFEYDDELVFDHSMTFMCGAGNRGAPNLKLTSLSAKQVHMKVSGVRLVGCVLDRVTTGTITGDGIVLGDVTTIASGCSITVSTNLLACPSANFASGDSGKQISIELAGPSNYYLITTISSVVDPTHVNVASAASSTQSNSKVYYANPIFDNRIDDVIGLNSVNPVRIDVGQKWDISRSFFLGPNGALIQNVTAPDSGEGYVSNSTFFPTDLVDGYGVKWTSSGGLRLNNVKITGGKYGIFQNWTIGGSGGLFASLLGIENCTGAGFYSLNTVNLPRTELQGTTFGCDGTTAKAVVIDPASTVAMTELVIIGSTYKGANPGIIFDINQVDGFIFGENAVANSGVGTCLSLAATVSSARIGSNLLDCATETTGGAPTDLRFSAEIWNFGLALNGLVYANGGNSRQMSATAAATNGQLWVGQTGAAPLPKTITGDVTFTAAGAATIANDAVTSAKIINLSLIHISEPTRPY